MLERIRYGKAVKGDYELLKMRFHSKHADDPRFKNAVECFYFNKDVCETKRSYWNVQMCLFIAQRILV